MILLGIFVILLQGFFSGSETALIAANRIRITNWLREGRRGVGHTLELLDHKEAVLVTTLLGTNLSVVIASFLFSTYFIDAFGPKGATFAVLLNVVLSLVLGEFLPKAAAAVHADGWSVLVTPVFRFLVRFTPAARLFPALVPTKEKSQLSMTRRDFLVALRAAEKAGHLPDRFAGIVANLFSFADTQVHEIMTPISAVVGLGEDATDDDLIRKVREHGFSRYPVFDRAGEVKGVVHAKDIILGLPERRREVCRVAWNGKATRCLNEMKRRHTHIAVVHDAQGRPVGLVTLEDLVEELVGEIRSEAR